MIETRFCCGERIATPFCPHCGTKAGASPLGSLLHHIDTMCVRFEREISERKLSGQGASASRGLAKREAVLRKWAAWRDAVAECICKSRTEAL